MEWRTFSEYNTNAGSKKSTRFSIWRDELGKNGRVSSRWISDATSYSLEKLANISLVMLHIKIIEAILQNFGDYLAKKNINSSKNIAKQWATFKHVLRFWLINKFEGFDWSTRTFRTARLWLNWSRQLDLDLDNRWFCNWTVRQYHNFRILARRLQNTDQQECSGFDWIETGRCTLPPCL